MLGLRQSSGVGAPPEQWCWGFARAVVLGLRQSSGVGAPPEQWCWGSVRAEVLGLRQSSGFGVRNSAKVRVFVVDIDIE